MKKYKIGTRRYNHLISYIKKVGTIIPNGVGGNYKVFQFYFDNAFIRNPKSNMDMVIRKIYTDGDIILCTHDYDDDVIPYPLDNTCGYNLMNIIKYIKKDIKNRYDKYRHYEYGHDTSIAYLHLKNRIIKLGHEAMMNEGELPIVFPAGMWLTFKDQPIEVIRLIHTIEPDNTLSYNNVKHMSESELNSIIVGFISRSKIMENDHGLGILIREFADTNMNFMLSHYDTHSPSTYGRYIYNQPIFYNHITKDHVGRTISLHGDGTVCCTRRTGALLKEVEYIYVSVYKDPALIYNIIKEDYNIGGHRY